MKLKADRLLSNYLFVKTVFMDKKILLTTICTAIINLTMFAGATFLDDSVSWLYKNGYTIFGKVSDYKPKNYLRRDEAAKFFVKVAE